MSTAPARSASWTWAGVRNGFFERRSAATAAECGAAAEVPKKVQDGGQYGKPPAFVIVTPSKPARSGFGRIAGAGNETTDGPREL